MKQYLFLINYTRDGRKSSYQIPAVSEWNALVRLGQIHGDNVDRRHDIEINVIDIKKTNPV